MKYDIVNIVCDTNIDTELNLYKIKVECENTEYEPEVYFALIYHVKNPKISILVNKSGKIIFTGAKRIEDIEKARDLFFDELKRMSYFPKKNLIRFQNIVVIANLHRKIDLNKIMIENMNNPPLFFKHKTFPGITYRSKGPKFSGLIFNSGKIVLTGLKDIKNINYAFSIIKNSIGDS